MAIARNDPFTTGRYVVQFRASHVFDDFHAPPRWRMIDTLTGEVVQEFQADDPAFAWEAVNRQDARLANGTEDQSDPG